MLVGKKHSVATGGKADRSEAKLSSSVAPCALYSKAWSSRVVSELSRARVCARLIKSVAYLQASSSLSSAASHVRCNYANSSRWQMDTACSTNTQRHTQCRVAAALKCNCCQKLSTVDCRLSLVSTLSSTCRMHIHAGTQNIQLQ